MGQNLTRLQSLLEKELNSEPLWKAFLIRALQIIYAVLRDLKDGQLSLQAMSLVYTTLITLVPLLAISFSVLKGFGVHNQIEPILLNVLEGLGPEKSGEITERVIGFVDNIEVGVLGTVGLALLIYAVIALMQKIEAAFNYIWRVGQERTISQRFSYYLSVLLMGPLLIFVSAGITTTIRHSEVFQRLSGTGTLGPVYEFTGLLVPWIVLALGFTFIYIYMPNTKVRAPAAFTGALVAALLWKAMGFLFSTFIASSANYVAIYAAFATLIVLMIWLYASWLVVLIGSNVSFYTQYPRYLRISREPVVLSPYMRLSLGLSALSLIAESHYGDKEPWTLEELSKKLNVPILAIEEVIQVLKDKKIVAESLDDKPRFYPACPLDTTPLQKVIDALEKGGHKGWVHGEKMAVTPAAKNVIEILYNARYKAVASKTISETLIKA